MSTNGAVQVWEGMPVARSLDEFAAGVRRICNFKREFEFRLGDGSAAVHPELLGQQQIAGEGLKDMLPRPDGSEVRHDGYTMPPA